MRSAILAFLLLTSTAAFAQPEKPEPPKSFTCGKDAAECQKVVDGQADQIKRQAAAIQVLRQQRIDARANADDVQAQAGVDAMMAPAPKPAPAVSK